MPDELESCIQCGGVLVPSETAKSSTTSPIDGEKKKEWLSEQSKIKDELSDLITRLGGDPSTDAGSSLISEKDESKPTGSLLKEGTESLLGHRDTQPAPKKDIDPELKKEMDDLRAEGYIVIRLEKAIEENPESAWKIFSEFLDDIDKLKDLKERLDNLDSTGREIQIDNIKSKLNNPDLISDLENQINELEQSVPVTSLSEEPEPVTKVLTKEPESEPERLSEKYPDKKVLEQEYQEINELIESGKDAYRNDEYKKSLKYFSEALKMDPENKEVQFFKKKAITKITEAEQGIRAVSAEIEAIAGEEAYESWDQNLKRKPKKDKKGKKKKKKDKAKKIEKAKKKEIAKKKEKVKKKVPKDKGKKEVAESRSATELEALGFNAYINKDFAKALDFYEKVLEIDPNFPGVKARIDECKEKLG
jgi:tetratricopeptide (TPR) repeat protein